MNCERNPAPAKSLLTRFLENTGLALARVDDKELMEDPRQDVALLRESLAELERVNRLLRGNAMTLRCVRDLMAAESRASSFHTSFSVLDVCCGGADVSREIADWAQRRGFSPRIVASDISPTILGLAGERGKVTGDRSTVYALADARDLPYPDSEFDLVNMSLSLHHFPPLEAEAVLREMRRVASTGVVVTDLYRSWRCLAAAHIIGRSLIPGLLARHDGPLSVRRSYLPREAAQLANAAGFERVLVRRIAGFRYSLTCWV